MFRAVCSRVSGRTLAAATATATAASIMPYSVAHAQEDPAMKDMSARLARIEAMLEHQQSQQHSTDMTWADHVMDGRLFDAGPPPLHTTPPPVTRLTAPSPTSQFNLFEPIRRYHM